MTEFYSKIVGSTFCGGQELMNDLVEGEELLLVPEPTNKYDKNAIMVCRQDKIQIGYIPKATAEGLKKEIDSGSKFKCTVSEITGGSVEKANLGCNIHIKQIEAI